jgi:hypothetical protein
MPERVFRHLLVPTDGSDASVAAARLAFRWRTRSTPASTAVRDRHAAVRGAAPLRPARARGDPARAARARRALRRRAARGGRADRPARSTRRSGAATPSRRSSRGRATGNVDLIVDGARRPPPAHAGAARLGGRAGAGVRPLPRDGRPKCHSGAGYHDFLGLDGSEAGVVSAAAHPGVITCVTCHNDVSVEQTEVLMPSGEMLTGLGREAVCMECHQGRQSGASVAAAIERAGVDHDAVMDDQGFLNIHYYAAAATLYGSDAHGGFEYPGKRLRAALRCTSRATPPASRATTRTASRSTSSPAPRATSASRRSPTCATSGCPARSPTTTATATSAPASTTRSTTSARCSST